MTNCLLSAGEFVKGYAPAASAMVASGTFAFSVWKLREDAALQRELEAKRRWTAFMDMAIANPRAAFKPDYSSWKLLPAEDRGERPVEDIEHANFVSRFLFTAEEVLAISPNDPEWIESIKSQMDCHRKYFLSEMKEKQIKCYSKALQDVIRNWREERSVQDRSEVREDPHA